MEHVFHTALMSAAHSALYTAALRTFSLNCGIHTKCICSFRANRSTYLPPSNIIANNVYNLMENQLFSGVNTFLKVKINLVIFKVAISMHSQINTYFNDALYKGVK